MAKKRKAPPKAQQIKMIEGALRSKKVKAHLKPGLRLRLAILRWKR